MAAMNVVVTSHEFDGLVNPYTKEPISVKMVVGCGPEPLFHSDETFSTSDLQPSTKDLYRLWSRIEGREGLRTGLPKCAYTGEPLTVEEFDGKFRFIGGFDPRVLRTRDEFLYFATMRDGVSSFPKPGVTERVVKSDIEATASRSQKSHADSVTPGVSQDSIEIAAGLIDRHKGELPLPTKVGFFGRRHRK